MKDNNTLVYIVAMITLLFNLFGTHLRKSKWFSYRLRWLLSIGLFVIGLLCLNLISGMNSDQKEACILLMTPMGLILIDGILKYMSIQFQDRDFQFNTSFEYIINQHKRDLSIWDNVITVILLLTMVGLLILSSLFVELMN